ncbi:hypothetical protein Tco_0712316 [Tanacetum coccineum]
MSSKDAKEEGTESESVDANLTGSMVKSSKKKKLKQLDFITKKGEHIHLIADQIKEQKKLEELAKADMAKQEVKLGKEELVDLLGINVVRGFYKAKLKYIGRMEPMKSSMTSKPVTYTLVNRGSKPLSEQDPLDKLNDLARKKRKNADDIHDYFRSTKKFKLSVQYEDHPARTVLNELCLGMIMFNSVQRQDFVTIKDFGDFLNKMLYNVQEIFSRLHQVPGLDDYARTFSSLLLAKVDKGT